MSEDHLRIRAEQLASTAPAVVPEVHSDDPIALRAQLSAQLHDLQVHQIELELQNQELQRSNRELENARHEFQELFEGAPVGYVVLDADGFIRRVNRAAVSQLLPLGSTLIGRRFSSFISASDARSFVLFLRRIMQSGTATPLEVSLTSSTGAVVVMQLEGQVVPSVADTTTQCRVTLTDITAQRVAQAEVQRLNDSLEARVATRTAELAALNEELESFMFAVSHELLTPVRQARDIGQRIANTGEPVTLEAHRQAQGQMEQAMVQMETLLQGLLDYFRSGQQRLRFRPVNLNQVITQVRRDMEAQVEGRDVRFSVDALPVVHGDSTAVQLIFSILLGNALKFTHNVETAHIRISCREHADEYVFCVEDNGAGFNMREKLRLFGMFQRLHSSREFEGVGVGLAVVKRFVQRHGGRVWAEEQVGRGATFSFALPKTQTPAD